MTADHLFPILESEVGLFVQVVSRLAVGDIPEEVDGIRLGWLTVWPSLVEV